MEAAGINRRLVINVTKSVSVRLARYTSELPDSNGCLIWNGATRNGYGALKIDGKVFGTHCVAFVAAGGVIEEGCVIAHKCDVKLCVNPSHLECVSVQKNNADMQARRVRTAPRGEELPQSVLTDDLVRQIRSMFKPRAFSYRKIAKTLNLNESVVQNVIYGRQWKHVTT